MSQYAPSRVPAYGDNDSRRGAAAVLNVSLDASRGAIDAGRDHWNAIVAAEGRTHLRGEIDGAHRTLTGRGAKAQPTMHAFQYVLIVAVLLLTFALAQSWFSRYELVAATLRYGNQDDYDTHVAGWMPLVLIGVTLLTLLPMSAFVWRSLSPRRLRVLATIAYWTAPVLSIIFLIVVAAVGTGAYGAGGLFGFLVLNLLHMAAWIKNFLVVTKAERTA